MSEKPLTIDSLSQASCKTLLGQSQEILRGDFETWCVLESKSTQTDLGANNPGKAPALTDLNQF